MRDRYDMLEDLNRAGVHIIARGDGLQWRCDPTRPPIPSWLFLELQEQKADVRRILLDVPAGCRVRHICDQLGICWREIGHSACTDAAPQP